MGRCVRVCVWPHPNPPHPNPQTRTPLLTVGMVLTSDAAITVARVSTRPTGGCYLARSRSLSLSLSCRRPVKYITLHHRRRPASRLFLSVGIHGNNIKYEFPGGKKRTAWFTRVLHGDSALARLSSFLHVMGGRRSGNGNPNVGMLTCVCEY